jgi:predicted branched-subunit amino acid permease
MVVGPIVPTSWRLDFAPAVMFAGITLLAIDRRPAALAAFVGGTVSLVTAGLPDRLGIVIGAVCGIAAGTALELAVEPKLAGADDAKDAPR